MLCRLGAGAVVVCWLLLVVDAVPGLELLWGSADLHRLTLGAVTVGSVLLYLRHTRRPEEEVFDAGRAYERRCVLREMNAATVTPIRRVKVDS